MQSTLLAATGPSSPVSLLAFAYRRELLLYNLTARSMVKLISPTAAVRAASSRHADSAADDAHNDGDNEGEDEDGEEDEEETKDEKSSRPSAPAAASGAPAAGRGKSMDPRSMSVFDLLQAQNSLQTARFLCFTEDGALLCVAADDKTVNMYDTTTGSCRHSLTMSKKPVAAALLPAALLASATSSSSSSSSASSPSHLLMVADKVGDIYSCLLPPSSPPVMTLGHLASVTQLAFASASHRHFLLSSDSDGKVRVSRHPQHYDIHSFCLSDRSAEQQQQHAASAWIRSHTSLSACSAAAVLSFITAFGVVGDGLLVSGGRGAQLELWNFLSGERLQTVAAFPSDFISAIVVDASTGRIVVAAHPASCVSTFTLQDGRLQLSSPIIPAVASPIAGLCSDNNGTVFTCDEQQHITAWQWQEEQAEWAEQQQEAVSLLNAEIAELTGGEQKEQERAAAVPVWSVAQTVWYRHQERQRRERDIRQRAERAQQRQQQNKKQRQ